MLQEKDANGSGTGSLIIKATVPQRDLLLELLNNSHFIGSSAEEIVELKSVMREAKVDVDTS